MQTKPLTQVEFSPADFRKAEKIAVAMGYKQYAYTSTSDLWGYFCLRENPEHSSGPQFNGCIIKTQELGFLFVQDVEDLRLDDRATTIDPMAMLDTLRIVRGYLQTMVRCDAIAEAPWMKQLYRLLEGK